MNFSSLRYFLIATQTLNFSKAAEKLFVSQQALSNCIKGIEEELGVKLFTRGGKQTTLTYAGMRFATYAADIVALEENMRHEMQHLQTQDKGTLRITVNETRASALMPEVLEKFYQKYPYVEVSLIEGDATRVSDSILTNDADFGVGLGLTRNGIREEKILDETLCLIVPAQYAATFLNNAAAIQTLAKGNPGAAVLLRDIPFIMLNKTMFIRQWTDEFLESIGVRPNVLFEATSVQTLFSMVCRGLGIAVCTESFMYSFRAELESRVDVLFVYPLKGAESKELGIFHRSNYAPSEYAQYCTRLIRQYYEDRSVEYQNGKILFHLKGDA